MNEPRYMIECSAGEVVGLIDVLDEYLRNTSPGLRDALEVADMKALRERIADTKPYGDKTTMKALAHDGDLIEMTVVPSKTHDGAEIDVATSFNGYAPQVKLDRPVYMCGCGAVVRVDEAPTCEKWPPTTRTQIGWEL